VGDALNDDLYASADLSSPIPKYRFPHMETDLRGAASLVEDQLLLDGDERLNVATFCTSWFEPGVTDLLNRCFDGRSARRPRHRGH
jgi:glutamate decarboxylase